MFAVYKRNHTQIVTVPLTVKVGPLSGGGPRVRIPLALSLSEVGRLPGGVAPRGLRQGQGTSRAFGGAGLTFSGSDAPLERGDTLREPLDLALGAPLVRPTLIGLGPAVELVPFMQPSLPLCRCAGSICCCWHSVVSACSSRLSWRGRVRWSNSHQRLPLRHGPPAARGRGRKGSSRSSLASRPRARRERTANQRLRGERAAPVCWIPPSHSRDYG